MADNIRYTGKQISHNGTLYNLVELGCYCKSDRYSDSVEDVVSTLHLKDVKSTSRLSSLAGETV